MKEIYPEYADQVAFYVVSQDPTAGDLQQFDEQRKEEGWVWPVAEADGNMLRDLNVVWWSTKIAFDGDGVIRYRDGYGGRDDKATWRQAFLNMVQPVSS